MLFGKYASSKTEALYPSLRDRLELAICPSIQSPSGLIAYDFSGWNRFGTLTNMDPATAWGRNESSVSLVMDNTNDVIRTSRITAIQETRNLTIALRYRPNSVSGMYSLFEQWRGSPQQGVIGFTINNTIAWQIGGSRLTSTITISQNEWNSIVCICRSNTLELWINGTRNTATEPTGDAANVAFERVFSIGAANVGGIGFTNGAVDDVCVWSRALSGSESRRYCAVRAAVFAVRKRFAAGSSFNRRRRLLVGAGS
jgi:hypothetical protein